PGGRFHLGATPDEPFVFDNEKWAHPVELRPFAIARAAVTQDEFAGFVQAGGYARRELWTDAGWSWRESAQAEHPGYCRRDGGGRGLVGTTPAGDRRHLVRGGRLLPMGRPSAADRGRVGSGRRRPRPEPPLSLGR